MSYIDNCILGHPDVGPSPSLAGQAAVKLTSSQMRRGAVTTVRALQFSQVMLSSASSPLVRRFRDLPFIRGAARARRRLLETVRIRREAHRARSAPDEFDRAFGVETRLAVGLVDLCRLIVRGGNEHEPSPPDLVRKIIASLDVKFSETVFVDYGSGAGRVVALASEFPFKRVIGVELTAALHTRAQATVAAIQRADRPRAPISLICADVTRYELPQDALVIYVYNTFGPRLMPRVVAGIAESLRLRPRPITIVALFCDRDSRPILERAPLFRPVRSERDVLILRDVLTGAA